MTVEAESGRAAGAARRLLAVPVAMLVLHAVEALVAVATVGVLRLLPLDQAPARLGVTRLAKVETYPHTASTALVTITVAAVMTAILLRPRSVIATFAADMLPAAHRMSCLLSRSVFWSP